MGTETSGFTTFNFYDREFLEQYIQVTVVRQFLPQYILEDYFPRRDVRHLDIVVLIAREKPMLYQQLLQIREQLEVGDIKVSDALLLISRCLRGKIDDSRLVWLNRELLGYRREDLAVFYERPKFGLSYLFGGRDLDESEIPTYRFLMGAWGKMDRQGKLVCVQEARLVSKSIFCNIGIQQIETQLEEMDEPTASLFSISADQSTGAEFYCWSRELFRIKQEVRDKLCAFIDTVVNELEASHNDGDK